MVNTWWRNRQMSRSIWFRWWLASRTVWIRGHFSITRINSILIFMYILHLANWQLWRLDDVNINRLNLHQYSASDHSLWGSYVIFLNLIPTTYITSDYKMLWNNFSFLHAYLWTTQFFLLRLINSGLVHERKRGLFHTNIFLFIHWPICNLLTIQMEE